MNNLMMRLWSDDAGFIVSTELVFVATIAVLGLVTGLAAVRNSVVSELTEVGNAISGLQQCYSFSGLSNCTSSTCGSAVTDSNGTISLSSTAPTTISAEQTRCP